MRNMLAISESTQSWDRSERVHLPHAKIRGVATGECNCRLVTFRYIPADHTPTARRGRLADGIRYGFLVTAAAETLLEQALTLPLEDRALLASGLLASLDSESVEDAEVDRLWSAESQRRATLLDSAEAGLVTWDHLVARIDERRA